VSSKVKAVYLRTVCLRWSQTDIIERLFALTTIDLGRNITSPNFVQYCLTTHNLLKNEISSTLLNWAQPQKHLIANIHHWLCKRSFGFVSGMSRSRGGFSQHFYLVRLVREYASRRCEFQWSRGEARLASKTSEIKLWYAIATAVMQKVGRLQTHASRAKQARDLWRIEMAQAV
jgi:hypothetical protein